METPEQVAAEVADRRYIGVHTNSRDIGGSGFRQAIAIAAIKADRAQLRSLADEAREAIAQNEESRDATDMDDVFSARDVSDGVLLRLVAYVEEAI